MHLHFIAIGGAVMHNLAIALHKKGYKITGSDDEIFEPSLSRLKQYGLLPAAWGWHPENLSPSVGAVILGMHARADNPELIRAKELGLKIYSFPEYLFEQTKNKTRVVIAGSHGKTTVTSMIMHALRAGGRKFDYMVGSILAGFDTMVELDDSNDIAVFEGDEYLTSPIDPRPKFHVYQPHISLITGIAWDHMNVFPDFGIYRKQFEIFAGMTSSSLVYYGEDPILREIAEKEKERIPVYPYTELTSCSADEATLVVMGNFAVTLQLIGKHNIQNLTGAMQVCKLLGMEEKEFLQNMTTFKGAARRQELLAENKHTKVYLDFAHSPSKVMATVKAFRQHYREYKLIACLELHTFSSLNLSFLSQYKSTLDAADMAIVFYDPHVVVHKKLTPFPPETVTRAFGRDDLIVMQEPKAIEELLLSLPSENKVFLIMTSGNFSGLDVRELAGRIVGEAGNGVTE